MLRFLLDENLRGPLWSALARHNVLNLGLPIDVVRVGDEGTPPLGSADGAILEWCELNARILVSLDKQTIPEHLAAFLARKRSSPEVLLVRLGGRVSTLVEYLELIAHASNADEHRDRIVFIP